MPGVLQLGPVILRFEPVPGSVSFTQEPGDLLGGAVGRKGACLSSCSLSLLSHVGPVDLTHMFGDRAIEPMWLGQHTSPSLSLVRSWYKRWTPLSVWTYRCTKPHVQSQEALGTLKPLHHAPS